MLEWTTWESSCILDFSSNIYLIDCDYFFVTLFKTFGFFLLTLYWRLLKQSVKCWRKVNTQLLDNILSFQKSDQLLVILSLIELFSIHNFLTLCFFYQSKTNKISFLFFSFEKNSKNVSILWLVTNNLSVLSWCEVTKFLWFGILFEKVHTTTKSKQI